MCSDATRAMPNFLEWGLTLAEFLYGGDDDGFVAGHTPSCTSCVKKKKKKTKKDEKKERIALRCKLFLGI